jgi:hypothetical protein
MTAAIDNSLQEASLFWYFDGLLSNTTPGRRGYRKGDLRGGIGLFAAFHLKVQKARYFKLLTGQRLPPSSGPLFLLLCHYGTMIAGVTVKCHCSKSSRVYT